MGRERWIDLQRRHNNSRLFLSSSSSAAAAFRASTPRRGGPPASGRNAAAMTRNWPEMGAEGGAAAGDEEGEEFYESFDRILSSSCSSTSASDDEADPRNHRGRAGRSAAAAASRHQRSFSDMYDVWIGEPGSVEERRRRLLQKLGLIGDPALARRRGEEEGERAPGPGSSAGSDVAGKPGAAAGEREALCRIRNLDSGVEFVVKEVREDGMWKELREVGTGRQLTMEEFQISVIGHSPIVQELMRRQKGEVFGFPGGRRESWGGGEGLGARLRRRGGWFRSIRLAGSGGRRGEKRSSDERDTSSEKGGRRSSSATDDGQESHSNHGTGRVRVRQYGKSWKELSGLCMSQEIQAHCGSIWCIRFSLDGRYLASAGEDCVIHVWQVVESERKRDYSVENGMGTGGNGEHQNVAVNGDNGSPQATPAQVSLERDGSERRRRLKVPGSRKSLSLDHIAIPEYVFGLSEKPVCSFVGHQKDVLDLSWSKSALLLSSSMDKTVKLWDMSSNSCLKTFSHSDYVTCIQFNPVNDNYFISGSLDAKVRLWSIDERQVVDWTDLHEMVTAACYTPDGQGAFVGSHAGSCNFYNTSEHKLLEKSLVNLQNRKKKSHFKKITGFQFSPGSSSEVFVTSADSRIRVIDSLDLVHKFKGFRNTSSQISASVTADGKHVICASEDSHVYIWRYDADSRPNRSKGVAETHSYEYFHCTDVSVAVAWPGTSLHATQRMNCYPLNTDDTPSIGVFKNHLKSPLPVHRCNASPRNLTISPPSTNLFSDRVSATWPEEKLFSPDIAQSPRNSCELKSEALDRSAWGMVIVTAGRGGEIKAFQNFGYPVRS